MIISEKQVHDLMLVANLYLRILDRLESINPDALSEGGNQNKIHVANLIQDIIGQQSVANMVIQ